MDIPRPSKLLDRLGRLNIVGRFLKEIYVQTKLPEYALDYAGLSGKEKLTKADQEMKSSIIKYITSNKGKIVDTIHHNAQYLRGMERMDTKSMIEDRITKLYKKLQQKDRNISLKQLERYINQQEATGNLSLLGYEAPDLISSVDLTSSKFPGTAPDSYNMGLSRYRYLGLVKDSAEYRQRANELNRRAIESRSLESFASGKELERGISEIELKSRQMASANKDAIASLENLDLRSSLYNRMLNLIREENPQITIRRKDDISEELMDLASIKEATTILSNESNKEMLGRLYRTDAALRGLGVIGAGVQAGLVAGAGKLIYDSVRKRRKKKRDWIPFI